MFSSYSNTLDAFERHMGASELTALQRGVEREALRITPQGQLATTPHLPALGSALTHPMITTDYAEALLELITPVHTSVRGMLATLGDVHRFVLRHIEDERLWPLSMPCYVGDPADITLAQYGSSNMGRMKTLYREGLKRRYGSMMQIIAGVHYNFSMPDSFWPKWQAALEDRSPLQAFISSQYMALVRNYRRHVWVIPYLFGASPTLCQSFLNGQPSALPFEVLGQGTLTLPYATSLRLSDLGYTNNSQARLAISYNSLPEYVSSLRQACRTPAPEFAHIGVKVGHEWRQLNANVLQIENELYAPIRPKRVAESGQHPSDALEQGGVQYIEVRALDNNPFEPLGISEDQARFLDLFLVWCLLKPSPMLNAANMAESRHNLDQVVLRGREPGLQLAYDGKERTLQACGRHMMNELRPLAELLDGYRSNPVYLPMLERLQTWFDEPELTLSGQLKAAFVSCGLDHTGYALELADTYRRQLLGQPYQRLNEAVLKREAGLSLQRQQRLEAADRVSFDRFIDDYFKL